MKKYSLYILLFLILIVIIIIFGITNPFKKRNNSNLKTVKVAEVTHSVFYTPFYVAIENGYFKDEGIDIDLMLVSGSDNVAASVLSGDTLVGLAGPESAVYVYLGREKDYLQVFTGLTKRDGQFIMARTKEFDWQDLKNKEILVGRSTGMPALSFFKALENKGINKNDLKINTSVEFAELAGSFIGGNGDFVNLFEPLATNLEKNNQGFVVESVGLASNEFPYTVFYTKKSTVEKDRDLIKGFSNAIKKALEYTMNNDGLTIAKTIKPQFSDTEIEDMAIMIERYKKADAWMTTTNINEKFYNTLIDLLKENDLIKEKVSYQDLVINFDE